MEHTFKAVDEALEALHADVAAMGDLAVAQLAAAIGAFVRGDAVEAAAVVAADARLDALEADIERRAVRFIALHQPVADDLRAPIAALKTAMSLERCGDLAKNVAKRVRQLKSPPDPVHAQRLNALAAKVGERLGAVMAAYRTLDAEAARQVWSRDSEIDDLHEHVFQAILADMGGNPAAAEASMHLLFISKNLERIGDHATNIAESICYRSPGDELPDRPKAG